MPYSIDNAEANPALNRREIRHFGARRLLLRRGESGPDIFTLYSGWAFAFRVLANQRRQITRFYVPGDIIWIGSLYFPRRELQFSVRSLTAVSLCVFSSHDMADFMCLSHEFRSRVHDIAFDEISLLERRVEDLGRRSAMGRMAQLIVELQQRLQVKGLSQGGAFEFPIGQEHLADALGLTSVYVNRTLKRLRESGLIAFERGSMTILDMARLRTIAEEN